MERNYTNLNLDLEFLSWDWVDMTRLTPIIQINQGNTRSATVNPAEKKVSLRLFLNMNQLFMNVFKIELNLYYREPECGINYQPVTNPDQA